MLIPRTNKVYYKDGYRPALTLPKWKAVFKAVGIGDEGLTDLRSMAPEKILANLYPMVVNPGKGVYLEYDLTNNSELYDKVSQLVATYANISTQSAQLLAQVYEYGSGTESEDSSTYEEQITADYFRTEAVSYIKQMRNAFETTYNLFMDNNEFDSDEPEELLGSIEATTRSFFVDTGTTYTSNSEQVAYIKESKLNADQVLGVVQRVRDTYIEYLRRISSNLLTGTSYSTSEYVETVNKVVEGLHSIGRDQETSEVSKKRVLVVRLYPTNAQLIYGNPQVSTSPLSHNKFLVTKLKSTNIVINLSSVAMLNSEDTQWFQFYAQLFTYLVDYGNPIFNLVVGYNKILACSLAKIPKFADNGNPIEIGNFTILSSKDGLNIEEA
jgi:hypothetical protein